MALRVVRKRGGVTVKEDDDLLRGMGEYVRLGNLSVRAGIIEGESPDYDDGTSVVEVATKQHDGEGNIPSRPWLEIAMDRNERYLVAQMEDMAEAVLTGRTTAFKQVDLIGQQAVNMQKQTLQQLRSMGVQPLADKTIEAKAERRASGQKPSSGYPVEFPLIETGHLMNAHVWVVEGE